MTAASPSLPPPEAVAAADVERVMLMRRGGAPPKTDELDDYVTVLVREWERADRDRAGRVLVVETDPADLQRLRILLDPNVTLDRAYAEIQAHYRRQGAALSTVEAVMWSLRTRGVAALREPDTRRRIAQLSEQQIIEVGDRLL